MPLISPGRSVFRALIAAASLCSLPCHAEIREIKTLSEILPSITPDTLLVFDLDNTLIVPDGDLGSDHWFYFLLRKYQEIDHLSADAAEDRAMEVWNRVQSGLAVHTVEAGTADLIRKQQDRGIVTIGLTARTPDIADTTLTQLHGASVDLGRHTACAFDFEWWCHDIVKYQAGILFVGDLSSKGEALTQFLTGLSLRPKRVVFVDDRLTQVSSVNEAMCAMGIECLAFRYGFLDERVARFNRDTKDIRTYLGELPRAESSGKSNAPNR